MKISYNWLKEFVDIKQTPGKLAEDLGMFGHSVESIKKINGDYVLDLEITANRGDCLSILGVAREVAAMYNIKLGYDLYKDDLDELFASSKISDKEMELDWNEPNVCLSYQAALIENIKVEKSPIWLQNRLELLGIRSINNVVDITNYIMIGTGQPTHAFDFDKINHKICETKNLKEKMLHEEKFSQIKIAQINIRTSRKDESLITLDGNRRILGEGMIVIDDGKKIYDLAGIMGGTNSEVDKNTKTIILQAAVFDPKKIRLVSKKLGLVTEASYRYERGVDIEGAYWALLRALDLLKKISPQTNIVSLASAIDDGYSMERKIKVNHLKVNKLLGTNITPENMIKYLSRLGFKTSKPYPSTTLQLSVGVPSYRAYDVTIWQDLAEEIARMHGYNKLNRNLPIKTAVKVNDRFDEKEALKDILAQQGFTEIYSYSFTDQRLLEILGYKLSDCRRVINGLTPETEYLRPNLLPSLLTAIAKNPWAPEVNVFEIGKVFDKNGEKTQLGIAQVGKNPTLIKSALQKLGINKPIESVDQSILDYLKIRRPVKYVILDLDSKLLKNTPLPRQSAVKSAQVRDRYHQISVFPPTIRDLAFIVDEKVDSEKIRQSIEKIDNHILLVELFDEFVSDKFGKDKKNVAYHVWLQDLKKPMNEKNTENISKKIIKIIENKFKAKLRG